MTTIRISGKIDEALKVYAEEKCLNVSKFVSRLIKEKLEREGISIEE